MVILTEICACFFASSLMSMPFKYLFRDRLLPCAKNCGCANVQTSLCSLVLIYVHVFIYKTGIKLADCQILFYHTTRGLERETVLCVIIAPSEGF